MNKRNIVVFSGGSAANNLVDVFGKLAEDKGCGLSYIIPISDNGGSSSELIRVFGGPGIGDVRSRLVRLIPSDPSNPSSTAIKTLFNHRLSPNPSSARLEWHSIIEGLHPLWSHIPSSKRELIRSFLNTINLEIVKRVRPSSSFNFQSASVGNLFLTGARLFTGSFESAIYLLGSITGVPSNVEVVPAINSNFSHHIRAGLRDGTVITGQNAISHPSAPSAPAPIPSPSPAPSSYPISTNGSSITGEQSPSESETAGREGVESPQPIHISVHSPTNSMDLFSHEQIEDANLPGSLPTLRKQYISFAKTHTSDLPSPIQRIWYINPYGQEIRPSPNPKVLECLDRAKAVVYSIGSLYTSIVPCLILRDVGERIRFGARYKVLILNGSLDRETRANGVEYTARDFIAAITGACAGREVREDEWRDYITHVIYLAGEGTPKVEREELGRLGIECVRIYGRRNIDGGGGMIYDGTALGQALGAIIGGGIVMDKSRRNTLNVGG